MRFLLDECCPRSLATALRADGHDVLHVTDALRGATDLDLARRADADLRLIVTQDFDFSELAVRHLTPRTGVIVLFCPALSPQELVARAMEVIRERGDGLVGCLTIAEAERVRARALDRP